MHISYRTPDPAGDDELLARLRTGDPRVVEELYRGSAETFMAWTSRAFPSLAAYVREEAYLEAVMCLYENVINGRLVQLTASLQTYLFAIGARLCKRLEKNQRRTINVSALFATKGKDHTEMPLEPPNLPELMDDPFGILGPSDEEQAARDRVADGLRRLTPDCRELLIGFYYQNLSIGELGEEFNYRDANVTRTRKSQCLARLRELLRPAATKPNTPDQP